MTTLPDERGRTDTPRAEEPTSTLMADLVAFLHHNAVSVLVGVIAVLLAHGAAIANYSLSIDESPLVVDPGASGVQLGRPAMALVKTVTRDLMPLPFWNTAVAALVLVVAGIAFAFLISRAAGRTTGHRAAVAMFLVVFLTLPLTAYMLVWGESAVAYSFGLLFAALAAWFAWLWAAEGWSVSAAMSALILAALAALTYQSDVFVALAGVVAAAIGNGLRSEQGSRSLRREIGLTIRLVGPIVLGAIAGAVVSLRLISDASRGPSYHSGLVGWGTAEPVEIVRDLAGQVWTYASGEGFFGGWVLIPTVLVAAALGLQLALRAVRGRSWWPVVLLVVLVLLPFGSSFATGTALPQRAMHAMPIAAGAVWLLWGFVFVRTTTRTVALAAATILLTLWHSGVTSHLYFVELTTYRTDVSIASRLTERLVAEGWDGSTTPIVSVGARPRTPIEDIQGGDVFGVPLFNDINNGGRTATFMRALGYPFVHPDTEQWIAALARAETMPVWPAEGSVLLGDGVAIVRFSDLD